MERSMNKVDITDSQVAILIEVDGQICLTKMSKDKYEAISELVKTATIELIKTNVDQDELNKFLMPNFFED